MYKCLSSQLNDSFLTDRRSWTRHAMTRIRNNSESAALDEYDDVKMVMHLHVKRILIIWFVCIHLYVVNWMSHTNQTTEHQPDMLHPALNIFWISIIVWIQWCNNIYGYILKRNIHNLICVHTCLSSKLNDSSSADHRSLTWYGTTSYKDDFESVTLCESNDVKIVIDLHVKQIFIIWFVCTYH